jgi:hypothetical protein
MNNFKIYGLVMLAIAIITGCSSKFLDVEPTGTTVTQKQYDDIAGSAAAHINGLYSKMIRYSDHDEFGQKSIDIKLDMISGDIALTGVNYGWFGSVDNLQEYSGGASFTLYMWLYYYQMIKNTNLIIQQGADIDLMNPNSAQLEQANAIGQAYAMRGYIYSCLSYIYPDYYGWNNNKYTVSDEIELPCVPYYDEKSPDNAAQPALTAREILDKSINDLDTAVKIMRNIGIRGSKTNIDADVASVMLAHALLHKMVDPIANITDLANKIDVLCNDVIAGGKYALLPYAQVLNTGFNTIAQNNNWMWGQDITSETSTGLGTFWGQMDIFTYSYAYAGDTKAIDKNLYASIPVTDIRRKWFDTLLVQYPLAPTGKFYDSRKVLGGDAEWLNDIFFMRMEEVYLIAAEAAVRNGDNPLAVQYLSALLDQRDPTVSATLTTLNSADLLEQIRYNWRVELWGEGKAFYTFKRFQARSDRGDNHIYKPGLSYDWFKNEVSFSIPSQEVKYNPHMGE